MQRETPADDVELDLATRLAAVDEARAEDAPGDPQRLTEGLPPDAAARLRESLDVLERIHARWPATPRAEYAPRAFGRFRIERELGRGGHGVVFLAVDPALDRRVALKVPRPELLDEPDWRRRFLREARALARLDHPGIVPILEAGEVDGVCFIASTYCDGPDLSAWQADRGAAIGPRVAARVARLIAEAVGHAHSRGVVHRDLKPSNILMQSDTAADGPDDPGIRPRVTDFGLAKLIDADAGLTRTGVVLGTPRYMAPEQGRSRHDLVGPPSDVYAVGAILDELLVGVRPPSALRAIVARCLADGPHRRYPDARELADDLGRFLEGRRVRASRCSPRSILDLARGRTAMTTVALALAVLTTLAIPILRRPRAGRPIPAPSRSLRSAARAEREALYVDDLKLIAELLPRDLQSTSYNLTLARTLLDRYRPQGSHAGPEDLRTWEWYHFQLMLDGRATTLDGHRGAIYHLEYSPDGARLASSGDDGIRIWDPAGIAAPRVIGTPPDCVNWVAFSPDGKSLATAGDDRTVQLWDIRSGRPLAPPMVHQEKVVVVLFEPDGLRLVACDRGGHVTTWDLASGSSIRSRKVDDITLEGMALSPDASTLAIAAHDKVSIWEYPGFARRLPAIRVEAGDQFDGVAFSHDGRRFATAGGAARNVRIWDTATGRLLHAFTHHADERVFTVAFSPDDRLLLSTGSDHSARIWDLASGLCVALLTGHDEWVWSGVFAPDGRALATGDGRGALRLWSHPHRTPETHSEPLASPAPALAFGADGHSLLAATRAGNIACLDRWTLQTSPGPPFRTAMPAMDAAFSADGDRLAIVDEDLGVSVGSPSVATPFFTLKEATGPRPCLAFASDGKALAYVDWGGRVVRVDLTALAPRPLPTGVQPTDPTALRFAPDGGLLAGTVDGRLIDCDGQPDPAAEPAHQGPVRCLAVSPDGTLCATGGEDGSMVVWGRASLRVRARFKGHQWPVDDLVFTSDGRSLVSAAEKVQLWNVATARPTYNLWPGLDGPGPPTRLAASADGNTIAAVVRTSVGPRVVIWRAAPREEP